MNYAQIEVTQDVIEPFGKVYRTYKWISNKNDYIRIAPDFDISELPWKLKRVSIGFDLYNTYIRKDASWYVEFFINLDKYWKWFYYRFIMTLNVWGLAHTPHGSVPTWKDILRKQ